MVLKEIMGYESVRTTQKYVHFWPEDLQKRHWKYSPAEDLFGELLIIQTGTFFYKYRALCLL